MAEVEVENDRHIRIVSLEDARDRLALIGSVALASVRRLVGYVRAGRGSTDQRAVEALEQSSLVERAKYTRDLSVCR